MPLDPSFDSQKPVLDHGYVRLLDIMGDDSSPDSDARISTGVAARSEDAQTTLVRFLLRHKHTTPFEGSVLKFEVRAPIMVIREWHRHRTFSYNEESGRYKQLDPLYYTPAPNRVAYQAKTNHQGSGEQHPDAERFIQEWNEEQQEFEADYTELIQTHNVARELARLNMPLAHYSTFVVTGNLLNWFRFLQLRMDQNAQYEIRMYANAIYELAKQYFPRSFEAFRDYWLEAVSLSKREADLLKQMLGTAITSETFVSAQPTPGPNFTKRESEEFRQKLVRMGLLAQ
ncbi:MAG: FAD-dependent thymidylate synthase [Bacteroidota bacterium]|nr:FAD-dependent thymidylate synthase [Bacteroidota bacterium]MDP4231737.1 FAD-dependent thymidylate synthase [Bacteroidota bacterium]MDP4243473.1 FAD-dependent thymidylate synthase [Bacteroidota bacterium]MDP4289362.1 FAD-dependent thymidylate synthase [Bacteroidota bacterium]